MRMESGEVQNFPNRTRVGRADFNWVTGSAIAGGTPNQQNPQVQFSWSDDGGSKWSYPVLRTLGAQAQASQRVTVSERWCFRASRAPLAYGCERSRVYAGFINGTQSPDPRAF